MNQTSVIKIDDSFDSIENLRKTMDNKTSHGMRKKYSVFLLFGILFSLSLYFDHKYQNLIVPQDYMYQNSIHDNTHQLRKLMGFSDDYKCNSNDNCFALMIDYLCCEVKY